MASIIFSHAKSCINKAKKQAREFCKHLDIDDPTRQPLFDKMYNKYLEQYLSEFDEYLEFSGKLHERYQLKALGKAPNNNYLITIRPKPDTACTIQDLVIMVERLVKRACFLKYCYSYEQKGTCLEDLGNGFHVHIVAQMKQKSKGEVARDVCSTFNSWIEKGWMTPEAGIDVKVSKNPDELVQNYLIDYKSDDDHKEPTKEWDNIWRGNNNLQSVYRSDMCPNAEIEEPK